jgi:hypothetical protein
VQFALCCAPKNQHGTPSRQAIASPCVAPPTPRLHPPASLLMDRTEEYHEACTAACAACGFQGAHARWSAAHRVLPPLTERSQFAQAAHALHGYIAEVARFLRANQRDYVTPGRRASATFCDHPCAAV